MRSKRPGVLYIISAASQQLSNRAKEVRDLRLRHWLLGLCQVDSLFSASVTSVSTLEERVLRTRVSLIAVKVKVVRAGCRLDVRIVLDRIGP